MSDLDKALQGEITRAELQSRLPPGCTLKEWTETQTTFEADVGAVHWVRDCGQITGCTDPADNGGPVCGAWRRA